jgi:hypothetical protein
VLIGALASVPPDVVRLLEQVQAMTADPPNRTHVPILQQQRRLAKGDVERLLVDYASGLSTRALASKYGIHRETVSAVLQREGVDRRPHVRKLTDQDVTLAAALYGSGASLASVGIAFGADAATVRRAFTKAGVPVRARRGWPPRD